MQMETLKIMHTKEIVTCVKFYVCIKYRIL